MERKEGSRISECLRNYNSGSFLDKANVLGEFCGFIHPNSDSQSQSWGASVLCWSDCTVLIRCKPSLDSILKLVVCYAFAVILYFILGNCILLRILFVSCMVSCAVFCSLIAWLLHRTFFR